MEARGAGPSPADRLRQAEQAAAERRVAPLAEAAAAMIERMLGSPAFVAMVGPSPALKVEVADASLGMTRISFEGRAGIFGFSVRPPLFPQDSDDTSDTIRFSIMKGWDLRKHLGDDSHYGPDDAVTGRMSDVDGVIAVTEDFVAEYLADVATTQVGRGWLAGTGDDAAAQPARDDAPVPLPAVAFAPAPVTARLRRLVTGMLRLFGR